MLKLQAPGEPPMWSMRDREGEMGERNEMSGGKVVFLLHNKMDSLRNSKEPVSHFYSLQSISSDSSAQSALLSHTRWDSMQWPLRHTKSVTAGQLTCSPTSKHTQTKENYQVLLFCFQDYPIRQESISFFKSDE